jgi:hypothetical protein
VEPVEDSDSSDDEPTRKVRKFVDGGSILSSSDSDSDTEGD